MRPCGGTGHVSVLLIGAEWFADRPGGLNRYLAGLLAALSGCDVSARAVVVGPASDAPNTVIGVGSMDWPLLRRLLNLRRAALGAADHADVVDVHFALYGLLAILTTRLRRLPLVVHFQGPWADESALALGQTSLVLGVKRVVEHAVYRRARAVVVLSKAFERIVIDRYGVKPGLVHVIPPGVDLCRFTLGSQADARSRLGLPAESFVVVAARRLDPRMGLDVLIEAWAEVQRTLPGAVLCIAGDGAQRDQLAAQAVTLPDPTRVRMVGLIGDEDLVSLYQAADCSVVPTRSLEGFGLVTLESLACGTPAVVTDVGGLPDGVLGLDPTLIVPAGNAHSLAIRLLRVADGDAPDHASCRAHAERFGWEEVGRMHARLYERIAARTPLVVYLDHAAVLSGGELALARMLPAMDDVRSHVILAEDGPLVGMLDDEGVSVEVLAMPSIARNVRRDRVSAGKLPLGSVIGTAAYVVRLACRLRRLQPDLVETNSLKAAVYGGVAARLAGVPVVWHVRDRIAPDYIPVGAVRLVRTLAKRVPAGIIANSAATLATVGPLAMPTTIIASPIDAHLLDRPRPARGGQPFTAVMVGRLAPWKGQTVFLKALNRAFPSGPERALIVGGALFGEIEYERKLVALVAELNLNDRVEFTGHADDVAAQLDRADVLVHASIIPEPFGLVIVEGMAAGLPVIAAAAGGPAETLTDGVDGLLYAPGDVEALAGALQRVAGDRELRRALGAAGRKRAADFLPDRAASRSTTLYRTVLQQR